MQPGCCKKKKQLLQTSLWPLIIHQVKTDRIITMTVFWCLILISCISYLRLSFFITWVYSSRRIRPNKHGRQSKASLRLRLFCMMKYMHRYKQKRWKYFGFVPNWISYFCPLFKPLKITLLGGSIVKEIYKNLKILFNTWQGGGVY